MQTGDTDYEGMQSMKTKLFFPILILLLANSALGDIRIQFEDVKTYRNGDIIVSAIAQNIGSRAYFFVPYGGRWQMVNVDDDQKSISVSYKHIPTGRTIKEIPSSVTIETIFDTYLEMDHQHEMPSTGTGGQVWKIIFTNISQEAENVKIDILGWEYMIGDLSKAKSARKERSVKIQTLIADGNKFQSEKSYEGVIKSFKQVIQLDNSYYNELSPKISICYLELGDVSYDNEAWASAIENYELCMKADYSNRKTIARNHGEATFQLAKDYYKDSDFLIASELFDKALDIDPDIEEEIHSLYNLIRINRISNIVFSSLPGVIQLYRTKDTAKMISEIFSGNLTQENTEAFKGLVMLGSFTVFSTISYFANNRAEAFYLDYSNATTRLDAEDYWEQTRSSQKTARNASVLAITSIAWSIYDSDNWVKSHNKTFSLKKRDYSVNMLPMINGDQVLINLTMNF